MKCGQKATKRALKNGVTIPTHSVLFMNNVVRSKKITFCTVGYVKTFSPPFIYAVRQFYHLNLFFPIFKMCLCLEILYVGGYYADMAYTKNLSIL